MRERAVAAGVSRSDCLPDDCIYLADDLDQGSALTWINAELALALKERGVPVFVNGARPLSPTLPRSELRRAPDAADAGRAAGRRRADQVVALSGRST